MATIPMLTIDGGAKLFYQWDRNKYLTVTGDATQVHFFIPGQEQAASIDVVNGLALVPNELFLLPGNVIAWAYKTDHSLEKHAWAVDPRPQPPGFVYTPTQIQTWTDIEEEMENAVAQANAARDMAVSSAKQALVMAIVLGG